MLTNHELNFGSTAENLRQAIEGESYENLTMYPAFAKNCKRRRPQ